MTQRGPIDPFGVPDTYADALADIEHSDGMTLLTFSRVRRADPDGLVVSRILMTRETYELVRQRIAGDRPSPRADYASGKTGCAGSC
jgi:hypothetical protein